MPVESPIDLVKRLRTTTEQMACSCSAPTSLWQDHSSAVLTAATRIESDTKRIAELERAIADDLFLNQLGEIGYVGLRDFAAMQARAETAERALAEERERCARVCDQIAINAEYRAAQHTDDGAKTSALDKMEGAQLCATAIRSGKPDGKE